MHGEYIPNDSNTITTGEFRKNIADVLNRAEYAKEVTYVKNAVRAKAAPVAIVPGELFRELLALRDEVAERAVVGEVAELADVAVRTNARRVHVKQAGAANFPSGPIPGDTPMFELDEPPVVGAA